MMDVLLAQPLKMNKSQKIKFFARLLPCDDMDWDNIRVETNVQLLHVRCLQDFKFPNRTDKRPRFWTYITDGVFYNARQEEVYRATMHDIVNTIYSGLDTIIMACGQSCSGKSFTMCALRSLFEYRGILPRFISKVYEDIENKSKEWNVKIGISFIECRANKLYDLIKDPTKTVDCKNVSIVNVESEEQLLALIFEGEGCRKVEYNATYLGAHCATAIITLHFECLSLIRSHAVVSTSKVHFIDLAGVETVGKRELTSFKNSVDQGAANFSKSVLEQLLMHMCRSDESIYNESYKKRGCKLLEYLGESFSAHSIIRFIGHIRPTRQDLEVSLSTMNFGHKVKHIHNLPLMHHTEQNAIVMLDNLKEQLSRMQEEAMVDKLLRGTNEVNTGNFSQARIQHLERLVQSYLDGQSSELNVLGNTENVIVLQMFRNLYRKKFQDAGRLTGKEKQDGKMLQKPTKEDLMPEPTMPSSTSVGKGKISLQQKDRRAPGIQPKKSVSETSKMAPETKPVVKGSKILPSALTPDDTISVNSGTTGEETALPYQDIFIPEADDRKTWNYFLADQDIPSNYLDDLADKVRKKRVAYELASEEYNETRANLERNRLAMKEITWKHQSTRTVAYEKYKHTVLTQDEKMMAKTVSKLEESERHLRKALETKYYDWKETARGFIQEKNKLYEKFKEYCAAKIHFTPPLFEKYETKHKEPSDAGLLEFSKQETARKYFICLQKKLVEKLLHDHKLS